MKKTFLSLVVLVGLTTTAACPGDGPGPGPGPVIGGAVVDCLGANRAQIDALISEFKPLLTEGRLEWSVVYERAKKAGKDVGGCVIAELVQFYLGGGYRGPVEDGWRAHEVLEKFRAEEAGGASFKTMCVRQDGTTEVCKL